MFPRLRHWFISAVALLAAWIPLGGAWAQSTLVAQGTTVYRTSGQLFTTPFNNSACFGCHYPTNAPAADSALSPPAFTTVSNHHLGANNVAFLIAAFKTVGGKMVSQIGAAVDSPSATQQDAYKKLSLYIGQFKAPATFTSSATMRVASGLSGTRDVYPLLKTDGTSGVASDAGLTITDITGATPLATSSAGGSASALQSVTAPGGISSLAYNLTYQSPAQYDGSDTFYVKIANPSGSVTQAVTVTVLGINSAASVRGVKGTAYTAGAGALYKVTSSDSGATSFASTALPAGLILNASTGDITGTPTQTGSFSVTVQATTTTATHSANGVVSKTITIFIDGISSASSASVAQGSALTPSYQITSFPSAQAGFYTLSSVPLGMSFSTATGILSGTPTVSGIYNLTVGAKTSAPVATYTQALTLTVSSAGTPTISTNIPISPLSSGNVNTVFDSAAYAVSLSNPSLTGMVYGASGLPTGLTISTSTGLITGTPSVSGDFPLTLTGSNSSGAGAPLSMTMRVNPTQVPGVASTPPLSVSPALTGTVGSLITPIQINASNAPITAGSYLASGLPTGLSADPNTGLITGTPSVSGDFSVTLSASNLIGQGSSTPVTIRINPNAVPDVTSTPPLQASPTATGTVGSAITPIQINATNLPIIAGGYAATGLPGGLSLDANTGLITGSPTQSGDFSVVLKATNPFGQGVASAVTIRINPNALPVLTSSPALQASPIVTGAVGSAIASIQILASNGPISAGSYLASGLPAGLSADASTGLITGTPTVSGDFSVVLQATNLVGQGSSTAVTIRINPNAAPVITSTPALQASPTATGTVGSAITPVQINASNLPITAGSYQATGLPSGLAVDANSGLITGTPTASGDFSVVLKASNVAGQGNSASVTIRINPNAVPVITSTPALQASPALTGTVGAAITPIQINATNLPITAGSFQATGLPSGLSLNASTGLITGTPTASGDFPVVLKASNLVGQGSSSSVTIRINPNAAPVVSSTPALQASPTVTGTVGSAIATIQINATNLPIITGGYSATGLPPGLGVNANSGAITGTPTQSGDFLVVLSATNPFGQGNATGVTIRINPNAVPVISGANTVTTNQNQAFAGYQISASNAPITAYSVVGPSVLPTGLSLNSATGAITGIPSTSGSVSTTLRAINIVGNSADFVLAFTLTPTLVPVVTAPLVVSPTATGTVGTAITAVQIAATNPPISAYGGTGLPAGLSVNASGQLVGTPTTSGDFPITLTATNASGTGSTASVTIRINPNAVPAVTSTPALQASPAVTGSVGSAITPIQINATNLPITAGSYQASGLPAGLAVDSNTGLITGTPTTSGDFPVVLRASNLVGQGSAASVTIRINPNAVPVITSTPALQASPSATGTVGTAITPVQINATNLPITAGSYVVTGLPGGLSVDANTGLITGTPTVSGDFPVVLKASNLIGQGSSASVTIRINPNAVPLVSSTPALQASPTVTGTVGSAIATIQINATNLPIVTGGYSATGLPPGLSVNANTGAITGTPTQSGDYAVILSAANLVGTGSTAAVTIRVNPNASPVVSATPALSASPAVTGTVGSAITPVQINATNLPVLTGGYSATGLPGGLAVNANTGLITGTPTASGDYAVVLRAANLVGTGSAASVTIRIHPNVVPAISSAASVATNVNAVFAGYQIVASQPPLTAYAVAPGSALPSGLSLNTATGLITGTPTASGAFSTNLTASNVVGASAPFTLSFTIIPTAFPVVTATIPAVAGTVGSAITPIQINATNPTISAYGASGLPAGLSVNGSGQIVGTPTQSGVFTVVLSATNAAGTGNSASLSLQVNPNVAPVISGAASVTTNVGQAFAGYQITASQAPILSYAVVAPSTLPAGLSLSTSTGAITGTPTQSGAFSTNLSATNAAGTSTPFALAFNIVPTAVPVVSATIPAVGGTVGTAITPIQINATNPVITGYSASGLPAGLTVNGSGQIVGTATQSGVFPVTLSATNAAGTGNSASLNLLINPNTVPLINSSATATGTANTPMAAYQLTATNAPITAFAVVAPSTLPAGLTLNTTTGAITGIPTASGSFTTSLSASNAAGTSASFTLSFTINPSTVPGITSPTFATVAAGAAITPIQIVATNPAILSYAANGLPPGLALNTATGVISGTPTSPGTYQATLSATNVVGPGSRVVQFTIGIPAPTACALSVPLNTPTSINLASCLFNGFAPTGVSILATPAHGTAQASGTTVLYTPVNNFFGTDTFTYVGIGPGGTSPQGVVNVTVTGRPDPLQQAAVTAVIAAQAETSTRFARAQVSNFQRRMEALHRGAGAGPAPGAGLQSGTPAQAGAPGLAGSGFASAAAATGTGAGATGGTAPAPMAGSLFSDSPSNVPAPIPSLASGVLAPRLGTVDTATRAAMGGSAFTGNPGAALALPRIYGREVVTDTGMGTTTSVQGATGIRESEALNAIASGTGLRSLPFSESVISLIRSRSVDLAGLGSGLGLNTTPDASGKTSYWVEGVASFGTRDASGGMSGTEFSSSGISIGVDHRINKELAVGMGVGYARDKATIGTDGSVNRSKGYSLAMYGSYQLTDTTYLDGLLGFGALDFDTKRFVQPMNDFALGQRNGTQIFGSLTGGYEWRQRDILVSPYARLDFSVDRLGNSTETGAGAAALTYFSQTNTSVQGSLGVRAESAHATSFGYAVPRVRAEVRHEFKGSGEAFVGYADQPGGPRYALAALGGSRNTMVLGIGSEFLMRDGLTLSMEYQLSHSFSNDSSYALRLRLSKDFDARGMPKLRLAPQEADDEPINLQFDAGYTTDSNVTRAKTGADRLNDDSYSVNVGKTWIHELGETSRVLVTGTAGGEKFHRFNGLSKAAVGVEAEYQYRASSEFDEPTFGVFGKFNAEDFESSLRDGYRLSLGVSLRQALTDRIGAFGAVSRNFRSARSAVFDNNESSVRGNLDYALSNSQTLYLGGELRRGDIASTGRATLENVTIAKVFVQDDVFPGGSNFSYKVEGTTVLTTLGYNLSFGPKDSLDLSWRHVRSTPGLRPSFVTSPRSYKANQLSAVYLLRF